MSVISGSGSTPLTQRLVELAGEIAFDEVGKWRVLEREYAGRTAPMGPTPKDVGKTIAGRLLRELSEEAYREHRVFDGAHLEALAECVERGETT